jgi:hypothetical protein
MDKKIQNWVLGDTVITCCFHKVKGFIINEPYEWEVGGGSYTIHSVKHNLLCNRTRSNIKGYCSVLLLEKTLHKL